MDLLTSVKLATSNLIEGDSLKPDYVTFWRLKALACALKA